MKQVSVMRQAFEKMPINIVTQSSPVVAQALRSMQHGAGVKEQREWNAHLKYGTYQKLSKLGIM